MRWKYRWKSLSTGTVISLPCACHPIRGLPSPDPSRMNTVFKASALSQALLLALVAPASLAAPADPAEPATTATPVTAVAAAPEPKRSAEPTSEHQSLMRSTYAILCVKKKKNNTPDI